MPMTFDEFESEFDYLDKYFQGKLTEAQIDIYFDELKIMPREAFSGVINKLRRNRRPLKSNFPTINEVFELYAMWKRENPTKIERRYEKTECIDCRSTGLLHFRKFHEDYYGFDQYISYVAICEKCQNWKNHFASKRNNNPYINISITSRQDLIDAGYEIHPEDYPELRKQETFKTREDIERQIPF